MKTRSHRYTQVVLPDPTAAQLEAAQARRRLEEAAPELLDVLRELIDSQAPRKGESEIWDQARIVIAKAKAEGEVQHDR